MSSFPPFIAALPEVDFPFKGVSGHLLQGERQQVVFVQSHRGTEVPAHSHRAQWEIVLAGEVLMRTEKGEKRYSVGESFYLAGVQQHSALEKAGYHAIMVFDQPDRYRVKG